MSEEVNLQRARIVELKHKSGGWPAVAINVSGGLWEVSGFAYKLATDELLSRFDIAVLAEFPVTLADLLPKGCTAFKFNRADDGVTCYAGWDDLIGWDASGIDIDERILTLQELEHFLRDDRNALDLATVVPLSPHPDWIEAQR